MAFSVLVDTVQQRLVADSVSTLVGAPDWDPSNLTNVYQDGVTGSVFLAPGMTLPGWLTSNSGIYAKLPPSDFTLSPSSTNWVYAAMNTDGAKFYRFVANTGGAGGITTYSVPANQPMVYEISQRTLTPGRNIIGDFGWGSSGDYTTGVALRFYSDSTADVYRNGVFIDTFTLSGQQPSYGQTDGQVPAQPVGAFFSFMLIPCRERELLVIGSGGAGFSVVFDDIPEGTTGAIITPNAPVWFYSAPGVDAFNRVSLCQFASTGNAIGKRSFFRYDPGASPAGGFQTYIDSTIPSGCSASLLVADGVNPAIAYANNTNGVRLNVTLNGTGAATPFIYGTRGYTVPQTGNTVGPPLELIDHTLELSYDCPDSFAGTRMSLTLSDPKAIIAEGVLLDPTNQPGALIDAIPERPFRVYDYDGNQILEGLNESPQFQDSTVFDTDGTTTYGDDTNKAEKVILELKDGAECANNFLFKDIIPLDGLSVTNAYKLICAELGFDVPIVSTALDSVYISQAGNPTNRFNLQIEPGDKGLEWLERIAKTYAANYFHAIVTESGKFQSCLKSEADMPSTPVVTLYDSIETAIAYGVTSPMYRDLFRSSHVRMLKTEANDIYVEGYDYRTQRPILAHAADSVNMDPTIIPALRTPAWRGQRISYTWIDPSIGDMDTALYCIDLLYNRLKIARSLVEFDADYYATLPKGSLVKLQYKAGGGVRDATTGEVQNPVTSRIKTISTRFVQVDDSGSAAMWRPTHYVAEVGTGTAPLHTRGTDLFTIEHEWTLRSVSKTVQWGDALQKETWTRPLIKQSG